MLAGVAVMVESCPELVEGMAEIEFSVLFRSCLKQRLPHEEALRREVQALVKECNAAQATIQWRFNTQDAGPNFTAFTLLISRLTEY